VSLAALSSRVIEAEEEPRPWQRPGFTWLGPGVGVQTPERDEAPTQRTSANTTGPASTPDSGTVRLLTMNAVQREDLTVPCPQNRVKIPRLLAAVIDALV
jgi:hypothetical protein